MKHHPHKSSLFDLDANIAALLIYLLPFLLGFISDSLSTVAWIIPLLAFIMEKESDFVIFHASNSLAFYVVKAGIYILASLLGVTTVVSSLVANIALVGILGAGITGILILIIGIAIAIVEIYIFVGNIIALVKSYSYEEVYLPIIIDIARFIQKLKR